MNDDDEDRAAILRRRQRLIALALSGLTSAAGCEDPAAHPLVKPERVVESEAAEGDVSEDEAEPEDPPQIAEAPEPYVVDPDEVQHAEEAKRRWRERRSAPRVCLSRPPPMACLSRRPPRPQPTVCLWKKPVDDEDA